MIFLFRTGVLATSITDELWGRYGNAILIRHDTPRVHNISYNLFIFYSQTRYLLYWVGYFCIILNTN